MKTFREGLGLFALSFKEVWIADKTYFFFNLLMLTAIPFQMNASIYLGSALINDLSSPNFEFGGVLRLIVLIVGMELAVTVLGQLQQKFNLAFTEKFTLRQKTRLLDYYYSIDLVEKENPSFHGKAQFNEFALSKIESNYQSFLSLASLLVSISLSLYLLRNLSPAAMICLLAVCVARGMLELKTIRNRVEVTNVLQTSHRTYGYLYQLLSNFTAHKEMMVNQAYPFFKKLWLERKREAFELQYGLEKKTIVFVTISKILSGLFKLGLAVLIIYYIYNRKLTIGDYMAITMAAPLIESNILNLFNLGGKFYENTSYLRLAGDMLSAGGGDAGSRGSVIGEIQSIEVRNLSFRYPNRTENALNGIRLSIRKGEKIAVVGDNASGKTTLVKLILGLYPPEPGSVFYNQTDLNDIHLPSVWNQVSAVFQDFSKYELDIRHNIAVSDLKEIHNDQRLYELADAFGIANIMLPERGLETQLGYLTEDSINLSGGQWQRIALARALFKQASLVVLDEPTSDIDPNSELELLNRLLDASGEKTLIVITHRIGIAANVDKIVVMQNGEIKEVGSHSDLVHAQGYYFDMWMKQKELYIKQEMEVAYP